ncbi:MAG: Gfo/Idh/MocA family oxidoreductase [Acidobacteria bacterium]|nr:Gfo/Idh/MocA family oxidoreductase [Acidobacteriota bacterium]MBI3280536.1 Gfo/Idh/MocA family oxidoreductase [Acidobacteriota bacterium]
MTRRREFVTAAGAAAIYRLAGPVALAAPARKIGPNDSVGLGFIGIGIRGTGLMEEFSRIPGARFIAAADLYDGHLARGREFTGGKMETGKRYEDILKRQDIDAVVIATPDHHHRHMTLEALAAGKHVYIEKPMTWSLKEGPEIIAAEKKSGKVLMVGSGGKTAAMTQKVKELIAGGALGKVSQIRMLNHRNNREGAWVYPIPPDASPQTIDWECFLGPRPKRPFNPEVFFRWRCWWEYSGGVATDLFVHMLTTLHEVMQVRAPSSVVSQGGLWFWKDGRTVPDVLESVFEYPQGFLAQLCVNLRNSAPAPPMTVYGDQATLVYDRDKIVVTGAPEDHDIQMYGTMAWPKAMRDEYLRSKGLDPANPRVPRSRPEPKEYTVERGPGHADFFLRSIREGTPSRENATEGHAAAGAAHLANMAYRDSRRMRWDFDSNKVTAE